VTGPEQKFLDDWSVCFRTRYGDPHPKHWYAFDTALVPDAVEGAGYLCEGSTERTPRFPAAPVPEGHWGVHEAHCCKRHGCTYDSYEQCPVVLGLVESDGSCESCSDPAEMAKELVEELASFCLPETEGVTFRTYIRRAQKIRALLAEQDD